MARSDHDKPRNRIKIDIDHDHKRGELGPFLVCLSGYNPSRNKKSWKVDENGNWEEN